MLVSIVFKLFRKLISQVFKTQVYFSNPSIINSISIKIHVKLESVHKRKPRKTWNTAWVAQMETTKRGTTLHCHHTPSWPTLVIDQDLERKSTTRMKKPTQRPRELDFNRCRHHLGDLFGCLCGLGFVRKISLVWSLYFLSSWVSDFDLSLFFVFVFGFLCLIFLCFFVFMGVVVWSFSVFCLMACVRFCVSSFDFWVFVELEFYRLKFHVNFDTNQVYDTWFVTMSSSLKHSKC